MSDTDSAAARDFAVEDSNGASTSRAVLLDPRNLSRAEYWRHVLTAAELIARGMPVPAPKAGPDAPMQLACVQHLLSEVRTLRAQAPAAWKPGFGELLEHVDSVRERGCTPQRKFLIRGGNPGCMACSDTRERKNQTQVDFLAHMQPYDDEMLGMTFATRWTCDDIVEWSDPETGGLFWHKERSKMGLPPQHFDENRHTPFANYVREVERRRSLFEMQQEYPASVEYMEQWDLGSWFLGKTCLAKMRTTMHLHTFFFELVYDAWISIPEGVNATDTNSLFSVTPDRGQKAEALLAHLRSAVASPKGTKGAKRVGEDQALWQDVDVYRMSVFADEQGNCKEQEASWMQARAQTLMREWLTRGGEQRRVQRRGRRVAPREWRGNWRRKTSSHVAAGGRDRSVSVRKRVGAWSTTTATRRRGRRRSRWRRSRWRRSRGGGAGGGAGRRTGRRWRCRRSGRRRPRAWRGTCTGRSPRGARRCSKHRSCSARWWSTGMTSTRPFSER